MRDEVSTQIERLGRVNSG